MNKFEATLEVLMLANSTESMSSRQPQEQVRYILELLQKIYERIDTIEQSRLNRGEDLRKFRSQLIQLFKITILTESFANLELSQKIDKLLDYLEKIYQQIPLGILESTESLNNPLFNLSSRTEGSFNPAGTDPRPFQPSNEGSELLPSSADGTDPLLFKPSNEESALLPRSIHGTDPLLFFNDH